MDNDNKTLKKMASAIRALSMDSVEKANSGHPGMPMGMADVATILYSEFLKFNPKNPHWPDRDRFILSAGHGSMLLYSLLYLTGYEDINIDDLKNFRKLGSKTAGHPEYGFLRGIETTTGPLGQGLGNAVGMVIAERVLNARFGNEAVDHHTYVIAGDGCLMEGISQEAISLAGHLQLSKLIVLFDDNEITIDGPTNLSISDNYELKFQSCNWDYQAIDGHNYAAIRQAIQKAKESDKPSIIACKTKIGFGAPTKQGKSSSHGSPLGEDEVKGARKNLEWAHDPFHVPDDILAEWKKAGDRSLEEYNTWSNIKLPEEFSKRIDGRLPKGWQDKILELKERYSNEKPKQATRKSSGEIIEALSEILPELLGGSADLTGSNNTKATKHKPITKDNFSGNYLYYGIREHAMAAIMNGLALHKGIIPFGGTFLVFADYCRPAIRLSAMMGLKVIYIMTHDSIGLGEDGPTHQPVEHLASLRAIPNLRVFRPADAIETAECWELALEYNGPSLLSLTRQSVPLIREFVDSNNLCAKGAYIISEAKGELKATILATGSEVQLGLEAQKELHDSNIGTRVISMPCMELFDEQPKEYFMEFICNSSVKIGVEAACRMSWERYIGAHSSFIGMNGFGASGKASDLFNRFSITKEKIVQKIKDKISSKEGNNTSPFN